MIIDFEHHYIPAELGRRLGIDPTRREAVKTRDATVHAQLFDLEAQLRDMDRVGIDVAVQSCILGWDTTLENSRLINDCTAAAQNRYAGRFVGLAHAPILEQGGLRELERAIGELGLKGVTISSQVNGLPVDAKEFGAFYELMRRLRVPIFVHPALAPKGYSLMNDYQLAVILTREFDLGLAVTRLIAGGVVERYPDLNFVFAHFGGGLAGYKERIARSSYRFKLPQRFEEYFDRLYFDMAGFEGSSIALRCALEAIRPERMIFATDYPQNFNNSDPKHGKNVDGVREYIDEIRNLPLDPKVKNDMLGGTAAKLLKIGV
ncbi:MAG TPA: amidohydrolase family protein [Candidatus Binatia bacterium]|nr:amidohydrolase family protein [Candidatus Binatia bacterium]